MFGNLLCSEGRSHGVISKLTPNEDRRHPEVVLEGQLRGKLSSAQRSVLLGSSRRGVDL